MSTFEASEYDGARFPREQSTGVILGLGWEQVIVLAVGISSAVISVVTGGFPAGAIVALLIVVVFAGVGVPRIGGKSLIMWGWVYGRQLVRQVQGQNEYVPSSEGDPAFIDAAGEVRVGEYMPVGGPVRRAEDTVRDKKGRIKPPRGSRLKLPGEFGELQMFQLPAGAAFVYDPKRREGVVCARAQTEKAFPLEAFPEQEDRLRAWADVTTAISRVPGVARVQASDQTTIVSGAKLQEWYESKGAEATVIIDPETGEEQRQSGAGIDPFLHASFVDMMNDAEGQAVHELWLTLVLSRDALRKTIRANGGGLRGFMDAALNVMGMVESALPESGARVVSWHTPRSMASLVRSAFDPASSMDLSDRLGDREGAAPESAGPMHAKWGNDLFESDGALHRTFKISEWPQAQARLGFLDKFVFAGDFRHTVSLYLRPRGVRQAYRAIEQGKADWGTNDQIRRRLGRQESRRHEMQRDDFEREEGELVQGHVPLKITCLITVSAFTAEELESISGEMDTRAAEAGCEIRVLRGEQEAAFVASATPLGRLLL